MMKLSWALRGVAGGLLLLATAAQTRADQVGWSYQWASSPQVIYSTSTKSLLVMPDTGPSAETSGPQTLTAAVLGISSASQSSPDTVPQTPYTLTLTLTDKATGQQLPVNFSGNIGGTLWSGGASLSNVINDPNQTVSAGKDVYHVSFVSLGAPTPEGSITQTLFTFRVDAAQMPEPSTLVLGLLAVPCLLASARTRRRPTPAV